MAAACNAPVHYFLPGERTCLCGGVAVPDPTTRAGRGWNAGLGPRKPPRPKTKPEPPPDAH